MLIDVLEIITLVLAPVFIVNVGLIWPVQIFAGKFKGAWYSSQEEAAWVYSTGERFERKLFLSILPLIFLATAGVSLILKFASDAFYSTFPQDALVDWPANNYLVLLIPSIFLGLVIGGALGEIFARRWYRARGSNIFRVHEKYVQMKWGFRRPGYASACLAGLVTLYSLLFLGFIASTWVVLDEKGLELRRPLDLGTEYYKWEQVSRVEVSEILTDYRDRYVERKVLKFYFSNGKTWSTESSFLDAHAYLDKFHQFTGLHAVPVEHLRAAHYLPFVKSPRLPQSF